MTTQIEFNKSTMTVRDLEKVADAMELIIRSLHRFDEAKAKHDYSLDVAAEMLHVVRQQAADITVY